MEDLIHAFVFKRNEVEVHQDHEVNHYDHAQRTPQESSEIEVHQAHEDHSWKT